MRLIKDSHRYRTGQVLAILLVISQWLYAGPTVPVLSERAKTIVPDVLRRMQSEDPNVRFGLIDELVDTGSVDDFRRPSLRYALTDSDYSIILQNALEDLAGEFSDRDIHRLLYKVQYICGIHRLAGIDGAISEFAGSPSFDVSHTALRILVDLKSPLAVPYLIPSLSDPQKYHYALKDIVAVNGTGAIPQIRQLLSSSNNRKQHWAVWALFNLDAKQCADQIYNLCVENQPWREINRCYVLAVLTKWEDSRVFGLVMNWLMDSDGAYRELMISHLTKVEATAIEPSVIGFLESDRLVGNDRGTDANIKADAMRLLGKLKSRKVIPFLRKRITKKRYDFLEHVAAEQLGLLEAKEAVPELLTMLDSRRYSDYYAATLSLARIGEPSTVERILIELKKRKANSHHVEVLEALSKVSAPDTYQVLRDKEMMGLPSLPVEDYFAHVGDKAGIAVRLSDSILQKDKDQRVSGQTGHTALSALRHGVNILNYSKYNHALFVEKDLVHVVLVEEAYAMWGDWLAAQRQGEQLNPAENTDKPHL
jgi:HEAT repeat protein